MKNYIDEDLTPLQQLLQEHCDDEELVMDLLFDRYSFATDHKVKTEAKEMHNELAQKIHQRTNRITYNLL